MDYLLYYVSSLSSVTDDICFAQDSQPTNYRNWLKTCKPFVLSFGYLSLIDPHLSTDRKRSRPPEWVTRHRKESSQPVHWVTGLKTAVRLFMGHVPVESGEPETYLTPRSIPQSRTLSRRFGSLPFPSSSLSLSYPILFLLLSFFLGIL